MKIANDRPFPVDAMELDPNNFSAEQIKAFKERYEIHDMPNLADLLKK